MVVRNRRELLEAYRIEEFGRLFITSDAEEIVKELLNTTYNLRFIRK